MTVRKRLLPDGAAGAFSAVWRRLRGVASPTRAGISVALGVWIGCLPLYGLHLPLCLLVCVPLRLDAVLAYVGANISNPFVAPALLTLEVQVGSWLLTGTWISFDVARRGGPELGLLVREVALGSVVVGAALGVLLGAVAVLVAQLRRTSGDVSGVGHVDEAVSRTIARYRHARVGDRVYVAAKLSFDPVLRCLATLGPLGRVLDAGAGRGQLGLCLLELGQAASLVGFDFDPRKVALANAAARGDARFTVADLRNATFSGADTILLVDVLHYLPVSEQDAVLARARDGLAESGRLIVREVDPRGTPRSWLARGLERLLARVGYNRTRAALAFRSPREIVASLEALGFECHDEDGGRGTPFANRLIVAVRPTLGRS